MKQLFKKLTVGKSTEYSLRCTNKKIKIPMHTPLQMMNKNWFKVRIII